MRPHRVATGRLVVQYWNPQHREPPEREIFAGSGHFPPIDARERWSARSFGFLESVE